MALWAPCFKYRLEVAKVTTAISLLTDQPEKHKLQSVNDVRLCLASSQVSSLNSFQHLQTRISSKMSRVIRGQEDHPAFKLLMREKTHTSFAKDDGVACLLASFLPVKFCQSKAMVTIIVDILIDLLID